MDYQNRVGSKKGGGGLAGFSETNRHRKEQLRKLAQEHIDFEKDPYHFRNHLGHIECRLCLTAHISDASYLAHTQGRKHQMNLARRQVKEETEKNNNDNTIISTNSVRVKKNVIKIGRPGYKITKIKDPVTRQLGLLFELNYPEIGLDVVPRYRIMSAFEQRVENPPDRKYQYLLIAAEPYETCAFKLPSTEIDQREAKMWSYYDKDTNEFFLQLFFRNEKDSRATRNYITNQGVNGSL
ncbi:putative splicing factor 3A subunit 2 [Nadsonia fulvescens var. elongata DSM 6958]|uniref:Putative splicing factor 3A subunit 2 n=1 Tax=Nadsonia fulvescens var. elongata DSM 6958 TaxID=857566 RepID=A0A1E3PJ92_9ASCO|nr:putative splicing factor 3A subunit 2 [Nadsonia fulvescens var. elongata DSM 6958]